MTQEKIKRPLWRRLRDRFKHKVLHSRNRPMDFRYVKSGGVEVGYAMPVFYPSFHDMAHHQIMGQLTSLHLLNGLQFNGYRVLFSCRVGEYQAMTVVQPVQIESEDEQKAAA